MQTETLFEKTNTKPNTLQMVIAGIMAAAVLVGGFFISLFVMATSILLLPFALFKMSKLQRQFEEAINTKSASNTDHDTIIEGEYVVTKDKG